MKLKKFALGNLAIVVASTALLAHAQDSQALLLGHTVPASFTERTITLNSDTKWVNVRAGESVRFLIGEGEFGWKFDGVSTQPFDLRLAAPAGSLNKAVTVYVTRMSARGN